MTETSDQTRIPGRFVVMGIVVVVSIIGFLIWRAIH